ncbi:hypothetical protein EVAR_12902_1 [Eumeta japonica]|uniref:Uncharacterized protein n=1 Tax=Eumeta variegata TaxID=151549 RepID=A0A4C1TVR8_EUMVA|nr:hypothetical protein EVAR_12902_1 [Eumeta japonica]
MTCSSRARISRKPKEVVYICPGFSLCLISSRAADKWMVIALSVPIIINGTLTDDFPAVLLVRTFIGCDFGRHRKELVYGSRAFLLFAVHHA